MFKVPTAMTRWQIHNWSGYDSAMYAYTAKVL
jgi:hypothetical protein